jgi:hypothetical protein
VEEGAQRLFFSADMTLDATKLLTITKMMVPELVQQVLRPKDASHAQLKSLIAGRMENCGKVKPLMLFRQILGEQAKIAIILLSLLISSS